MYIIYHIFVFQTSYLQYLSIHFTVANIHANFALPNNQRSVLAVMLPHD